MIEGPAATLANHDRGRRVAERSGFLRSAYWVRIERLAVLADLDRWDEVRDEIRSLLELDPVNTGEMTQRGIRIFQLRALLEAGELDEAAALVDPLLRGAREGEYLQLLVPALAAGALVLATRGEGQRALEVVREAIASAPEEGDHYLVLTAPDLVRACLAAGDAELAKAIVDGLEPPVPRLIACLATARAEISESAGDRGAALDAWRAAEAAWAPLGPTRELRIAREALDRLGAGAERV